MKVIGGKIAMMKVRIQIIVRMVTTQHMGHHHRRRCRRRRQTIQAAGVNIIHHVRAMTIYLIYDAMNNFKGVYNYKSFTLSLSFIFFIVCTY
jgi:hypothetical protein